jgi:GNAT superfamily N-acetyltransferase
MKDAAKLQIFSDVDAIDWPALANVFERAPLGKRDPVRLEQTFRNSGVCAFAWLDGQLVGTGRALTDQLSYAFILDVVLLPEHQGRGFGRQIMDYLATKSGARNHVLHAVPERQPFYAALGYRKMTTAMALFEHPDFWHENGYIE